MNDNRSELEKKLDRIATKRDYLIGWFVAVMAITVALILIPVVMP
jgi:hypothetical protein